VCGRYTHLLKWRELYSLYSMKGPAVEFDHRFNIAPTQRAPIVRQDEDGDRSVELMRWGLVPSWATDPKVGASMINARAEGIERKPAFRAAMARRRCIVPASGFYEWKKGEGGSGKQAYYIMASDDSALSIAGLWEFWKPPGAEGEAIVSFTIITTAPNEMMAEVHDRMPVILDARDFGRWLDPKVGAADVLGLLTAYPSELMRKWPVSSRVNSPRHDDAGCMRRSTESPPGDTPTLGDWGVE
jgi:putative SOS response-associated peptidase YedK